MSDGPLFVMRELAKRFKGRMSPITLIDVNVCVSASPPGKPWEFRVISGEPFSKQLRYSYRGRQTRMFGNSSFLHISIAGSFLVELLSVNEKNLVNPQLKHATPLTIGGREYPLFTDTGLVSLSQKAFLANPAFVSLIREIDLHAGEKLSVSAGDIAIYLKLPALERVTKSIDMIFDLAECVESADAGLDLMALPRQFHPLIPLINKWAIDDDSDREDFIATMSGIVLANLVRAVEPYLGSIDSYLDSFGDHAPSQEAVALGRLAECAIEAKQYLKTAG